MTTDHSTDHETGLPMIDRLASAVAMAEEVTR